MKVVGQIVHELHLNVGRRRPTDTMQVDSRELVALLEALPDYPYVRLEAGEIVRLTNYYWTKEAHACRGACQAPADGGTVLKSSAAPTTTEQCALAGAAAD